ncbi:MAG: gamma-glutamylcyclotransferase family protein [Nocardioidaceae bacterium]
MPLYAAYASNLDPARMLERCPHSPLRGTGWLAGWRLTFAGEDHGWDGALATIAEDPDSHVFVALYDVSPEDQRTLDGWETNVYRKLHVRAQTLDGEQVAWLYVLDAYEGGLPSAGYLSVVSEAAAAAGAPDDYVVELRRRPCRSMGS